MNTSAISESFDCHSHELEKLTVAVSGLSAAHTVYLAGGNVVVLDKQGKPPKSYGPYLKVTVSNHFNRFLRW